MKKTYTVIIAIVGVLLLITFVILMFNNPANKKSAVVSATSKKNATYMIEGKPVTLVNGVSKTEVAPGSASAITTQYFGNEVMHDFDGDGRQDVAFIITQNTGGSGTFYYVVAALNTVNGYVGSDGFLLGDRIAPQTTNIDEGSTTNGTNRQNVVVVNYADRKPGESFAVQPSQGKSVWLKLDTKTMQWGQVEQNFTGESQ